MGSAGQRDGLAGGLLHRHFHVDAIDAAQLGRLHQGFGRATRDQAAETAAKHFAGQDRLVMLMIDLAPFGEAIKWEVSRGGALFPHLYGDLPISAVAGKVILRLDDAGNHLFPAGF